MKVGLFGLHRGSAGPVDLELARRYADLGVDRLVVQPATTEGGAIDDH